MQLEDLGYNAFFEELRVSLKLPKSSMARVTSCHKDTYTVAGEKGEYAAKIAGKIFYAAMTKENFPAVGDWVSISGLEEDHPTINAMLPRKNVLIRKSTTNSDNQLIGANIDVGFVVQSVDRDYNLNRLDRYLTAIINCRIIPVLILHKTDLISEEELRAKISMVKKRFAALHTIPTSRMTKQGINILMKFIRKGLTYCFIGSSGVGKSSLINSLLGKETLEIGALSDYTKKGTHTTCSRSLLVLGNGGIVIDNPGMREFGIAGDTREAAGAEGVSGRSVSSAGAESVSSAMTDAPWRAGPDGVFDKIENLALKCKYSNCSHGGEAGCAVKDALDSGELDNKKYLSYIKLKKEIQRNTMTKFEKITKDKKFGKFCKTVMARRKKAQS